MERKSGRVGMLIVVLVVVVLMVAQNGKAQSGGNGIYACWGGCYNECILTTGKAPAERLTCYSQCLSGCVPRYPSDYQYYCAVGCSFATCIPLSSDGGRRERCFGNCGKTCKL